MSEIEKRELIEQQRKILEAGAQRADKRTGSFSFLTWSFFIAPLIVGEESSAATLKFAPAGEEDAKAAQANAAPQATNDDSPASDLSKASAEDQISRQLTASLEARAAQLDPAALLTPLSQEDAPKAGIAATASGGWDGGSDDSDTNSHGSQFSIDHSPVNWLTADSHLGGDLLPGWSMLDSVQPDVPGDLLGTSITGPGFATLLGGVNYLSNDLVAPIAPVQSTAQPTLATVTDSVGALTSDVAGTIAMLETTAQPTLATTVDTVGTLASDVAGTIATLETTAQPTLATVADAVGAVTNDMAGSIATLETITQPVLTTVCDTVGTIASDVAGTITTLPMLGAVSDTVGTLASDVVGSIATLETTEQPILATVADTVGTLTNDVVGAIAPPEAAASTLLAAGTDAALPAAADVLSLDVPVIVDVADQAHINQLVSEVQSSVPAADPHVPAPPGAIVDGVDATLAPAPGSDADPTSPPVADASQLAANHIGSSVLVSGAVNPLLPDLDDSSQAAAPETTTGVTNHAVASAAPVIDTADPLLAAMTSQPTTSSQTAASDSPGTHAPEISASPADVAETAPVTGAGLTSDVGQPGNTVADPLPNAAAIDIIEPAVDSAGISLSNPSTNLSQPNMEDTGFGQAGPADTLLALATGTDAPMQVPVFATAAPDNAAADVSNATTSADTTAITGDVIALNDAPSPSANSLFSGTQYTDYGVTLTSDIVVPQQPIVAPTDTATAQDTSVPVAGDVQQHAPSPTDIDTTPSIDHLGLRDAIL
jgi:hypothetical protein